MIWFGTISNNLIDHFPPSRAEMEHIPLTNYHFWSNLIVADIARVFRFPVYLLQYQFLPIMLSLSVGLSVIGFIRILNLPLAYGYWLTFFLYFGGDAIAWIMAVRGRGLEFTMSSLEDGVRFLGNFPRAYAVSVFLGSVNLLVLTIKKVKISIMWMALVIASLTGLKIYFAFFLIFGLWIYAAVEWIRHRTDILKLAFLSSFLSLLIYLPVNHSAGGLYFTGFWRFENFIVQPGLKLDRLELARVIFAGDGKWWRVLPYELLYMLLYIPAIFGSKIIAALTKKSWLQKIPSAFHIIFIPSIIVSLVLGFFFEQTTGGANTFNFLVVVFIAVSYYAALSALHLSLIKPWIIGMVLAVMIVVCTLPRAIHEAGANIRKITTGKSNTVPADMEVLSEYIRNHTEKDSVFLVDHRFIPQDSTTPYIHFLTGRPMYLSAPYLLANTNTDMFDRQRIKSSVFESTRAAALVRLLERTNIDYIIATDSSAFAATPSAEFLPVVYRNPSYALYQVSN